MRVTRAWYLGDLEVELGLSAVRSTFFYIVVDTNTIKIRQQLDQPDLDSAARAPPSPSRYEYLLCTRGCFELGGQLARHQGTLMAVSILLYLLILPCSGPFDSSLYRQ